MLLHGMPGSWETLTAETVAEAAQKVLISASHGELNPMITPCPTIWKAVALLEKADVFLEARQESPSNDSRNALVALFLRELKQFYGIVFLTTNRVEKFARSMEFRFHLALEYSPPDIQTRRQSRMKLLDDVPGNVMGIDDVGDAVESIYGQAQQKRNFEHPEHRPHSGEIQAGKACLGTH